LANQDPYKRRYSVTMTIARCEQRKRRCSKFRKEFAKFLIIVDIG